MNIQIIKQLGIILSFIVFNCSANQVGINYDPDWITKSRLALSITNNIYNRMIFDPTYDNSDLLFTQLQGFDTFATFIALQGFPYAFQDQIDDFDAFLLDLLSNSKKVLDSQQANEQVITQLIGNQSTAACHTQFAKAASTLRNSYQYVCNLVLYTPIGNVKKLKQDVVNSCGNSDMTCQQAVFTLLNMLKGVSYIGNSTCDLNQLFYNFALEPQNSTKQYKGWKGQYTNAAAYVFNLATIGLGIHSAVLQINSNDPAQWMVAQDLYQLMMREALERIQQYHQLLLTQTSYNSQLNLAKFIATNSSFSNSSTSYDTISKYTQYFLNYTAPQKQWFVQVFKAPSENDGIVQTSRCQDCFYIYNVNNTYHIFAAGIDTSAQANDDALNFDWISFERNGNYTNIQEFVNDSYRQTCLLGIMAYQPGTQNSVQYPFTFSGYRMLNDQYNFILWAVQGQCPGKQIIF